MDNTAFKKVHDVAFVFKIKRHAEGNFKNLWDLDVKVNGSESFDSVVHADSLSLVIDKIGYIFEKEGF